MSSPESEPGVQELFDAIASCVRNAVPLEEVVYRSASVRFANSVDFLSGAGAAAFGGRWNPRGIEAAYASLSIQTATSEAYQNILKHGFPPSSIRPRVFAGAQAKLHALLDLTDRHPRGRRRILDPGRRPRCLSRRLRRPNRSLLPGHAGRQKYRDLSRSLATRQQNRHSRPTRVASPPRATNVAILPVFMLAFLLAGRYS
jgi:RES domain